MANNEKPVSVGNWMLTIFLMWIPIVNFIMLLVWAFGGGSSESKSNWAKATLMWMLIGLTFYLLIIFMFGLGGFLSMRQEL